MVRPLARVVLAEIPRLSMGWPGPVESRAFGCRPLTHGCSGAGVVGPRDQRPRTKMSRAAAGFNGVTR